MVGSREANRYMAILTGGSGYFVVAAAAIVVKEEV